MSEARSEADPWGSLIRATLHPFTVALAVFFLGPSILAWVLRRLAATTTVVSENTAIVARNVKGAAVDILPGPSPATTAGEYFEQTAELAELRRLNVERS